MLLRKTLPSFPFLLASTALVAPVAHAQAHLTAFKDLGLSAFGELSHVDTDYNSTNVGGAVGFDATRFFRLVQPSIEFRGTWAPGDVVGQKTFLVGLKLEKRVSIFHPYVVAQVGPGSITFTHPTVRMSNGQLYTHDNSFVYNLGGGVDFDLRGNFAVKAEVTEQLWRLAPNDPRFEPVAASIGIVYRIPFRSLKR